MTAAKSHLLAYLKHTPGFEARHRDYIHLPIDEILRRFRAADPEAFRKCIDRFGRNGTPLPVPA